MRKIRKQILGVFQRKESLNYTQETFLFEALFLSFSHISLSIYFLENTLSEFKVQPIR